MLETARVCERFLEGACFAEAQCELAHSVGTRGLPCRKFATGRCTQGASCTYLHSKRAAPGSGAPVSTASWQESPEAEHVQPPAEGVLCPLWLKGTCRGGASCPQAHSRGSAGFPCHRFQAGSCARGFYCELLHSASAAPSAELVQPEDSGEEEEDEEEEEWPVLSTREVRWCKFFLAGICARGVSCRLAHSVGSKGVGCINYAAGSCVRGTSCRLMHSTRPAGHTALGVCRFGMDLGGVLYKHNNDVRGDSMGWQLSPDSAAPGAMESLTEIVRRFGPENVFVISKVLGRMRKMSETWLYETMDICVTTGLLRENVFFCDEVHGENGKGAIAETLGITHFVDDRDDALWAVYEDPVGNSGLAVEQCDGQLFHFARSGTGIRRPNPTSWPASDRPGCVVPVASWSEVLAELNIPPGLATPLETCHFFKCPPQAEDSA